MAFSLIKWPAIAGLLRVGQLTSNESCVICFFFAFMMFGNVAYRGWFNRRSVVTTAGKRRDSVSSPPSICGMHQATSWRVRGMSATCTQCHIVLVLGTTMHRICHTHASNPNSGGAPLWSHWPRRRPQTSPASMRRSPAASPAVPPAAALHFQLAYEHPIHALQAMLKDAQASQRTHSHVKANYWLQHACQRPHS